MKLIDRWWSEEEPVTHIYLWTAEGLWRLVTTVGEAEPEQTDYGSEDEARAAAHALMRDDRHWQRQPASRSAARPSP